MEKVISATLTVMIVILISACDAAINVGGRTLGVQGGKFIYSDGFVLAKYPHPYEKVWEASEKAIADLKAQEVSITQKIGAGQIKARLKEEQVTVLVKYLSKTETSVSVRVGIMGNPLAAQMFHDRISRSF